MGPSRLGIELPAFLGPQFDSAWNLVNAKLATKSRALPLFNIAWHGLGYRAKTTEQYSAIYVALPKYTSAGSEGHFRDDQVLVDYLFNACSALDCAVFAAYSIGSALDGITFPSDKAGHLQVDRRRIADLFVDIWPDEQLTHALEHVRDDKAIELLFKFRDVVTHRGTLPRTTTIALGVDGDPKVTIPSKVKELPDVWVSDQPIAPETVSDWQQQVADICGRVVAGVLSFGARF